MINSKKSNPLIKWVKVVGVISVCTLVLLVILSLITGYGFNLRRFGGDTKRLALLLINSQRIKNYSKGEFTNIVFLHLSVGANLILEGNVRGLLSQTGYTFWDQGYNEWGMVNPDGTSTGYHYRVPSNNTSPDGLANIFSQHLYSLPINTFSALMQHEVLIFKSCYPASDISSDEKLEQYKNWYRQIREITDQYPEHVFIFLTAPPLNPAATNLDIAARARVFNNWIKSDEFLQGHTNIYVFDFFDLLAESDPTSPEYNMLRTEYREGIDSHPNKQANEMIGPLFVGFIIKTVESVRANK